MNAQVVTALIDAGTAGLVIIVVLVFLKHMRGERVKSDAQSAAFLTFIGQQQEVNAKSEQAIALVNAEASKAMTATNAQAITQMADAMRGLAKEIASMNDRQIAHDTKMSQALEDMRIAKERARRVTNGKHAKGPQT